MICDVKKRFCPAVTRALIKQKFKKAGQVQAARL